MSNNNFYTPTTVRPLYKEIVPAYQAAFANEPWNEVSKCTDKQLRCVGGLSAIAIGSICNRCGLCPELPAYEADELIERFNALGVSRTTAWYAEQNEMGLTMAAVAWKAKPAYIASEKYSDVPVMSSWMTDMLGDEPIMWLDEVFSNKKVKISGNLKNFKKFVVGLAKMLDCDTVAYRTIEPRMMYVPSRDFKTNARILNEIVKVPDRRVFVIISNIEEAV